MSIADFEKHLKIFFSPEFKVQPGSEETYHSIAALLADKEIWNIVLKKADMKKPKKIPGGKYLTTCDEEYQIILKYFMDDVKGSEAAMIVELAECMGKSERSAAYTYSKNKASIKATAKTMKKLFKL